MSKCEWCDEEDKITYVRSNVNYPSYYCDDPREKTKTIPDPEWIGIRELARLVKIPMKKLKGKLFHLPMEYVLTFQTITPFGNKSKPQYKFHKDKTIKWIKEHV